MILVVFVLQLNLPLGNLRAIKTLSSMASTPPYPPDIELALYPITRKAATHKVSDLQTSISLLHPLKNLLCSFVSLGEPTPCKFTGKVLCTSLPFYPSGTFTFFQYCKSGNWDMPSEMASYWYQPDCCIRSQLRYT